MTADFYTGLAVGVPAGMALMVGLMWLAFRWLAEIIRQDVEIEDSEQ